MLAKGQRTAGTGTLDTVRRLWGKKPARDAPGGTGVRKTDDTSNQEKNVTSDVVV